MSRPAAAIAVVTAADSGIGKATALALARDGLDVGITFHTDEAGAQDTAAQVRALGRRAEVRQADLTDLPRGADVVDDLVGALGGRLWALVANAGGGQRSTTFLDQDLEGWRHDLALNLDGAFLSLQRGARHMLDGDGGRLVAITSVHESTPRVGAGAYVAAKHGLGGLVKTAAIELASHGITVNAVAPGEIATPLEGNPDVEPRPAGGDGPAGGPSPVPRPGIPAGRAGSAHEIAAVVAMLCREEASYVTGASYVVDGGMLAMAAMGASTLADDTWREG